MNEEVIEKFCEDLVNQRGQRYDDDSSENSTTVKPASSRQNTIDRSSTENGEKESEDDKMDQSFNQATVNLVPLCAASTIISILME